MSERAIRLFFRNDDVRDTLDDTLIELTELFLLHSVPISHAVEPANLKPPVIQWLLDKKIRYPELIEIIPHGFSHKINFEKKIGLRLRKGEFGGNRSYKEQLSEIQMGMELMNKYFEDKWLKIFTFPFGAYNLNALLVLKHLGYLGFSSSVSCNIINKIYYNLGHILKKEFLFKNKISYHSQTTPISGLKEYSTSISVIRKYISEVECEHQELNTIINQVYYCAQFNPIVGLLFHHRFHKLYLDQISRLLQTLKSDTLFKFCSLGTLIR